MTKPEILAAMREGLKNHLCYPDILASQYSRPLRDIGYSVEALDKVAALLATHEQQLQARATEAEAQVTALRALLRAYETERQWQPIETLPDPINELAHRRILVAIEDNDVQAVSVLGAHRLINAGPQRTIGWRWLPSPPHGDTLGQQMRAALGENGK